MERCLADLKQRRCYLLIFNFNRYAKQRKHYPKSSSDYK